MCTNLNFEQARSMIERRGESDALEERLPTDNVVAKRHEDAGSCNIENEPKEDRGGESG